MKERLQKELSIQKGKYRHYKGNLYEVLDVAKHSESLEEMVVYKALYGNAGIWVRPLKMFLGSVEVNGNIKKRFEFIGDELSNIIYIDDQTAEQNIPYKIIIDHNPSQDDNDVLTEGLVTDYERKMNTTRDKKFSVFLKNALGEIFGGIQASFDTESVYVETLWVNEKLRKKGYGSKLLNAAELEAIKNGCFFATLDTWDFQAEGFYLKNGYESMGEIKKYWREHSRIFFRKVLCVKTYTTYTN